MSGAGRPVAPPPSARHIEAFLEMLAAERGAARATVEAYRRDLAAAALFLAHSATSLDEAGPEDLRRYIAALARRSLAPRSVARRLSALRQFFRFLALEGRRSDDPCRDIDSPRLGRPLPKLLSVEEVEALIETAARDRSAEGLRLSAMLELLYATGLRISELVRLPLAAARRGSAVLTVRGKGDKERIVPLSEPARQALLAYQACRSHFLGEGRHSPWLFPSRGAGGHLTRRRVGQLLKGLAPKAGVDPSRLSPHVLRHAFASHLVDGGADLRSVQEMLGHADIATTEIYTHVQRGRLQRLVEAHHPLARRR
ncbi:MAG TPA: site-specific tyrosine recombinase XerD [Stellaceae bacterium]|nr:site-specific tyrosine recombinase XerD [Stellaceae bacterium]